MTTINKDLLKTLRGRIDAALAPLGTEFGVQITARNASFSATNATFKVELAIVGEKGAVTREMSALLRFGPMDGLTPEDRNKTFILPGGGTYTLHGYSPKGRTYPYLAQRLSDGAIYKLATDQVLRALGKA